MTSVVGVLLAAGSGERFGGPKALARDDDGTSWLLRSVQALRPCAEIVVVLGAGADEAAALLPMSVSRVRADDWAEGMGASLRAGLTALGADRSRRGARLPGRPPRRGRRRRGPAGRDGDGHRRPRAGGVRRRARPPRADRP